MLELYIKILISFFFDVATSALDAENEEIIHNNLQTFFKGKTVIIIAHRLSTVKNADQIIVLKNGEVAEQGDHQHLVGKKNRLLQPCKKPIRTWKLVIIINLQHIPL